MVKQKRVEVYESWIEVLLLVDWGCCLVEVRDVNVERSWLLTTFIHNGVWAVVAVNGGLLKGKHRARCAGVLKGSRK